jgi:hypothetical protein
LRAGRTKLSRTPTGRKDTTDSTDLIVIEDSMDTTVKNTTDIINIIAITIIKDLIITVKTHHGPKKGITSITVMRDVLDNTEH